jgi:hypothetical protein
MAVGVISICSPDRQVRPAASTPVAEAPAVTRAVLVDHLTPAGVQLDGAVWITSARRAG